MIKVLGLLLQAQQLVCQNACVNSVTCDCLAQWPLRVPCRKHCDRLAEMMWKTVTALRKRVLAWCQCRFGGKAPRFRLCVDFKLAPLFHQKTACIQKRQTFPLVSKDFIAFWLCDKTSVGVAFTISLPQMQVCGFFLWFFNLFCFYISNSSRVWADWPILTRHVDDKVWKLWFSGVCIYLWYF